MPAETDRQLASTHVGEDKGSEIAPGVFHLSLGFVNAYLLGDPNERNWALVDTGLPNHFEMIHAAAMRRFGGAPPLAIYLTHGHGDHSGSALALATFWNVPIYVHWRELPFVTGLSKYPPPDPTVGGALAFLSRFVPQTTMDLRPSVQPLPVENLPGLSGWEVIETPGHAPGQIAFFRAADRVLIAGDALTTMNLDSPRELLARTPTLAPPPPPLTPDWVQARGSLHALAERFPALLACGHGEPIQWPDLPEKLTAFADGFRIPGQGRYVSEPVETDRFGIVYLPPPAPDPQKKLAIGALTVAAAVAVVAWARQRGKERKS